MSKAKLAFDSSIKDAEQLLVHFIELHSKSPPDETEVLKRAGLIMALTAWETYVEDRVLEGVQTRLVALGGSPIASFVLRKLEEELKRFHNPNTEKSRKLFQDYLDVDVTSQWEWQHVDCASAKRNLDDLMSKRGDAVHRSKPQQTGVPAPHLVKRPELERAIKFLKDLVDATDRALA